MKAFPPVILLIAALTALLPAVGVCKVQDEIVIYGGEQDRPESESAAYVPDMADVAINAYMFFRIRSPAVGFSVAEREIIVLQRLVEAMSNGVISPVYVDMVRSAPTVYVGRYRIVSAYPVDAKAAKFTSTRALAEHWADGIRKGLLQTAPIWCLAKAPIYHVSLFDTVFFGLADQRDFPGVTARAMEVKARLVEIADDYQPAQASVQHAPDGSAMVMYQGEPVVTATHIDARVHDTTCADLAQTWLNRLNAGMKAING